MVDLFSSLRLGPVELVNRFVFPPIKTAYGKPSGEVTDRHILFYSRLAEQGPGLVILEPVSVTADGREHPKQLAVHHEKSASELKKIADAIHRKGRKACLHINHAGGAANPKVTGRPPWSSSPFTCARTGITAEPLSPEGIEEIIEGFRKATLKAVEAGFDAIELQAGHGYLLDQFLNPAINQRKDEYGSDRLLLATRVIQTVAEAGRNLALLVRVSGETMAPGKDTPPADIDRIVRIAEE